MLAASLFLLRTQLTQFLRSGRVQSAVQTAEGSRSRPPCPMARQLNTPHGHPTAAYIDGPTDGRISGQRARDRPGWGSHGDGFRSRWRPCINNPRPVADPASAKGIRFRGRRTANQRRVKRGGSTCASRRVARRRTWPRRPCAAAAGINCTPPPCPRPQTNSVSRTQTPDF